MRLLGLLAVTLCVGCGPRPETAPPRATAIDAGAAPSVPHDAVDAAPVALTRDECVAMIDHVLEIGMADQRARKPPDQVPTAEQVAAMRGRLIAAQLPPCLAMPRAQWTCVMAATTQAALYACAAP